MKRILPVIITVIVLALAVSAVVYAFTMKSRNNPGSSEKTESDIEIFEKVDFLMDTDVKQIIYGGDDSAGIASNVTAELVDLENKVSVYLPDSDIYKVNHAVWDFRDNFVGVEISELTYNFLTKAKELSLSSDGLFDITIGALTKAWGITSDEPKVPGESDIERLKTQVDANKLSLKDEKGKKRAAILLPFGQIDLGGIAKGYGCDLAMEAYRKTGITGACISIGGNIAVYGSPGDKEDFTVKLRNPFSKNATDSFGYLELNNTTVATSGAYERNVTIDGQVYHHIIDPRTGKPAQSGIQTVSVISDDGMYADYLSTLLFVGGMKKVTEYLNKDEVGIICVDDDKNVWVSNSLREKFELTAEGFNLK